MFIVRKVDNKYYLALSRKPTLAGTMYFGSWISFKFNNKCYAEDAAWTLNERYADQYEKIKDKKYPEELVYKILKVIIGHLDSDRVAPKPTLKQTWH